MNPTPPKNYEPTILPGLHRIQEKFGYLDRDELAAFARQASLPLYRIQAVASFFPHFRLTPPKTVSVNVCRDLSCHLAGSGKILAELADFDRDRIEVKGVSCLGRCDRAPAACVVQHHVRPYKSTEGHDSEAALYLHGRTGSQLKALLERLLQNGDIQASDGKAGHRDTTSDPDSNWVVGPTDGKTYSYPAAAKAIAARRESLRKSAEFLQRDRDWSRERAEQFRLAAERRLVVDFPIDDAMAEAVLAWQTADGWAKGTEFGDWSEVLLKELDDAHADLRGMGGAGVPAVQKWRDVRDAIRQLRRRRKQDAGFIIVNGDESEPGTFKDRELLLRFGHLVVEGVILAGLITDATQGFIYIRHEYPEEVDACRRQIARAEELGFCGENALELGRSFPVSVFVSPGGYICGEQSALIEAMSDRRAEPRNLPPKLETNGLDDRPTLVSNVETYAWSPYIVVNGGTQYADLGVNGWRGKRFFSVSGDVKRPGVYEVPIGMTLRELLCDARYCQGIAEDRMLKAFAPSGPSGGFLPAKLAVSGKLSASKAWLDLCSRHQLDAAAKELDILDLELELNLFRALSPTQALGAGLIVFHDGRNMLELAVNALEFFKNESCGKCVPCRIGSQKLVTLGRNLLERRIDSSQWREKLLPLARELGETMGLTSICGLGRSVPLPLQTVTDYFAEDVAAYLAENPAVPGGPPA
jgi:formate dehydrogenase beta subunit